MILYIFSMQSTSQYIIRCFYLHCWGFIARYDVLLNFSIHPMIILAPAVTEMKMWVKDHSPQIKHSQTKSIYYHDSQFLPLSTTITFVFNYFFGVYSGPVSLEAQRILNRPWKRRRAWVLATISRLRSLRWEEL